MLHYGCILILYRVCTLKQDDNDSYCLDGREEGVGLGELWASCNIFSMTHDARDSHPQATPAQPRRLFNPMPGIEPSPGDAATVPIRPTLHARDHFKFPIIPQNRHKSRKNYWRGQKKSGVTRDRRVGRIGTVHTTGRRGISHLTRKQFHQKKSIYRASAKQVD